MKYLLALLLSASAFAADVELNSGQARYIVYVDGVEVSRHTVEREAAQEALEQELNAQLGGADVVVTYTHHNYDVSVAITGLDAPAPGPIPDPAPTPDPVPHPNPHPDPTPDPEPGIATVNFSWILAPEADGYRIYHEGEMLAQVTGSSYTESLGLQPGTQSFSIEAYNNDETFPRKTVAQYWSSALEFDVSFLRVVGGPPPASGGGTLLANWNFADNAKPAAAYAGAQNGGTIGYASGYVEAVFPAPSDSVYAWFGLDVSAENTDNLYLDFDARMPSAVNGFKFVKIFGKTNAGNYSNVTFGLVYGSGVMQEVSFGDGSETQGDTQQVLRFDGSNPSWIGRSYNNGAVLSTPQSAFFTGWSDNDWHNFKLGVQFNSGTSAANEVNDGTFYVEIDGLVYCDSSGLFNRHWNNGNIEKVEFFGYASNGAAFTMQYDNIVISKDGFM